MVPVPGAMRPGCRQVLPVVVISVVATLPTFPLPSWFVLLFRALVGSLVFLDYPIGVLGRRRRAVATAGVSWPVIDSVFIKFKIIINRERVFLVD